MDIKTICIHGSDWKDPTGCISVPIFQSATFGHPELGESTGYDYTRVQNPTRECAEKVVAALEHGCDCTSYASGMAAISMVMELFKPGDTIISSDDLYGGSIRLFRFVNEKNGIHFKFVNTSYPDKVEEAFDDTVKALYIETPTNPMMQVTDIRKMADIAHAHGALLIADNTFMSPYFCNPIDFGADIVLHSGTKYLAGHNDTLAGFVVCRDREIADKVRFLYKTVGGLGDFLAGGGSDGGAVDDQCALGDMGQQPLLLALTEKQRFHMLAGGQHADDDLGPLHRRGAA